MNCMYSPTHPLIMPTAFMSKIRAGGEKGIVHVCSWLLCLNDAYTIFHHLNVWKEIIINKAGRGKAVQ